MIEFKHVSLKYPYDDYAILKDLDFTLIDGVNTILCDTQSGKSSVCKLLVKEVSPTSGQIFFNGQDIAGITNQGLGILYLPNNPVFFENRSVAYNVAYPLKTRKFAKEERRIRVNEATRTVGLNRLDVKLSKLSATERQKAAVARGLTVERQALLLDDFCDDVEQIERLVAMFNCVATVILTSNVNLALGNVIILDGGNTTYQGDAAGAREFTKNLSWIANMLRSE